MTEQPGRIPGLTGRLGPVLLHRMAYDEKLADRTLMVRVGPDAYEEVLAQPHVREMDFTGRPLNGIVYVDGAGVKSDPGMAEWTGRGVAFASTLPAKPPVKPKKSDAERRGASR